MLLLTALVLINAGLADGVEQAPEPEDVKAGGIAFVVFILLALAVALLGWSLFRQLRKAQAAKDAGVYGDEPATAGDPAPYTEGADPAPGREDPPRG